MIQLENEVGAFSEMDYNAIALRRYKEQVPQALVNYLLVNQTNLEPEYRHLYLF